MLVDPVPVGRHASVDAGMIAATVNSPGRDSCKNVLSTAAHHRTATVSLAGVGARSFWTSGVVQTDLFLRDLEEIEVISIPLFANGRRDHFDFYL